MNKKVILMMMLMCSVSGFSMSQSLDVSNAITTNSTVGSVTHNVSEISIIRVHVNGMVCSFCAQGIEKTFQKHEGVSDVVVDLETMIVALTLVPSMSISDDAIRQVIEDAGYSIEGIDR